MSDNGYIQTFGYNGGGKVTTPMQLRRRLNAKYLKKS